MTGSCPTIKQLHDLASVSVLPTLKSSPDCGMLSKFLNFSGDMATLWLLYPLCSITKSIAITPYQFLWASQGGASGKEPSCQCRRCKRPEFNPWVRKILGGGHGNPLQYSCLENPTDRGAWQAAVHSFAESDRTVVTYHACMH